MTVTLIHDRCSHSGLRPLTRLALQGALFCCAILVVPVHAAGKIYRSVDADGNVVFSDVAPRPDERAERVELGEINHIETQLAPAGITLEDWQDENADDAEQGPTYRSLVVAEPVNDANVRSNPGDVLVVAALQPELDSGHLVQLYLDGTLRESGPRTSFQLTNIDRGTHTVELKVVDAKGETVIASEPSVFHLQRYSQLLAPNRAK